MIFVYSYIASFKQMCHFGAVVLLHLYFVLCICLFVRTGYFVYLCMCV